MKSSQYQLFKDLHHQQKPFILTNIWDAASAAMVQKTAAPALATSSAALCWANGYADDGTIPRAVLLDAIRRIMRIAQVPLTVDIEDGYSKNTQEVVDLVIELVALGVAGINIEDGHDSPELLADKITAIRDSEVGSNLFVNARTDVLLRALQFDHSPTDEILSRAQLYQMAGADGIFIPGLDDTETISGLTRSLELPLNIMATNAPSDLNELAEIRVKRVSLGPNPFLQVYANLTTANFKIDYDSLNQLLS